MNKGSCKQNLFYLLTLSDCVFGMMYSQSNCSTLGVSFRFCALSTIFVSESVQCALCIVWMCVYAVCASIATSTFRSFVYMTYRQIKSSVPASANRLIEWRSNEMAREFSLSFTSVRFTFSCCSLHTVYVTIYLQYYALRQIVDV